jgi:hypothetical protein
MKKSILAAAITIMTLVGISSASAQMVDIGSGQMEQSEFNALKSMVQGQQTGSASVISTPLARLERYGPVEMTRDDFVALRDKVTGRNIMVETSPEIKPVQMVNIGTGEMPMDEFMTLKRMIENTDAFNMEHLAAIRP